MPAEKISSKKPSHIAYHVREGGEKSKGFWQRVGAAWKNRDNSITLQLDCIPLDGRIVLQTPKEKGDDAA